MCVRGDPEWAEEIVRVGRQNPRRLRTGLVEAEAARRRSALVVTDVQSENNVHRQIAEASLSRSYVTAPVLVAGRVVGLLHADCYFQRRNVDEFDRDVLAAFAAGYGYALERTMLLGRIAAMRESVDRLAGELTAVVDVTLGADVGHGDCLLDPECAEPPIAPAPTHPSSPSVAGLVPRPGPGCAAPRPAQRVEDVLSRRELDVLRLLAAGETNARIATRLVLSEGTVKTHVRNILRKLGAANRAEAVTRWLSGACRRR
jgi:DNA-binding CsgD family transcriptional regulator